MSLSPAPTKPSATEDRSRAVGRREGVVVGLIVLLGLGLRGLRSDAMAIEHFDEGVYASNLYCGHLDPPFAYPMRHLYAPPLFPALLEWAQILAGPLAAMWVNVVLGSLMVVAVWWTTRCWFGRAAAIAATTLAATSEYHIGFSRMALTDVPLSLFMLLGVFTGWKAIVTGRPLWIAAAGALAGLAWCTKYNGWLTLAVTGAGTLAAMLVPKLLLGMRSGLSSGAALAQKKIANCKLQIANWSLKAVAVRWGLTAAIAGGMFWVFVLRDLSPLGGYAAVAKNHAGYFVGLGGWWSGLLRQAAAHDLLMGWPTCVGIAAASALVAACHGGHLGLTRGANLMLIAVTGALLARLLTVSGLLAVAALVGFAVTFRRPAARRNDSEPTPLAGWMLLAWFFGLLVATPLYYPYPRLTVPWVVACWPLAGAAIAAMIERLIPAASTEVSPSDGNLSTNENQQTFAPLWNQRVPPLRPGTGGGRKGSALERRHTRSESGLQNRKTKIATPVGLTAACIALAGVVWMSGRGAMAFDWPPAWQQRSLAAGIAKVMLIEIETAAARTGRSNTSEVEAVVYVKGDPATFYQLATLCRSRSIIILPVADAAEMRATSGVPTFLVMRRTASEPEPAIPHLEFIQSYQFVPSDMVLLDRMSANVLRGASELPADVLRLDAVTAR